MSAQKWACNSLAERLANLPDEALLIVRDALSELARGRNRLMGASDEARACWIGERDSIELVERAANVAMNRRRESDWAAVRERTRKGVVS